MAKKTEKERALEILDYNIAKETALLENWEKYCVSQNKIDKLQAKKAKKIAKKAEIEAS